MSASTTTVAFHELRVPDKVQAALPMARAILLEGIDPCTRRTEELIVERCAALADDDLLRAAYREYGEKRAADLHDWMEAAFALGIALGLLLRLEAFDESLKARGQR